LTPFDPGWLALPAAFRTTQTHDGKGIARTRMSGLIGGHDMSYRKQDLPLPPSSAASGPLGWVAMLPAWQSMAESETRAMPPPVPTRDGAVRPGLVAQGLRRLARSAATVWGLLRTLLGWTVRRRHAPTVAAAPEPALTRPLRLDRAPESRKAAA
jgi:hypothetical protein